MRSFVVRRVHILMHVMMIPEGVVIIFIGMNIQIWGKYFALDIEAENSLKRRSLLNEYFIYFIENR